MAKKLPVALPFMGEFGSLVAKHVPGIHGSERPLLVCHEAGYEPLYPNAAERWTYERPPASERSAGGNRYQVKFKDTRKLKWPEGRVPYMEQIKAHFGPDREYVEPNIPFKWPARYFVPQHTGEYSCDFDVLLFARRQQYAAARNFPYWSQFQQALAAEGIRCLVAGQPDSTALLDCPAIWDLIDKPSQILDATIWAISKAKMRIGTATGTTLLSQLCGKPVVIIMSETGHCVQGDKMSMPAGYYYAIDWLRQGYRVIAHWMEWERTVEEFLWMYKDLDKFNQDCRDWIKKIHENLEIPDPDKRWRQVK